MIEIAKTNRYVCTICHKKITKGNKFFRDVLQAWRASHTVNICKGCMIRLALECGITDEQINQTKKQIIVDKI